MTDPNSMSKVHPDGADVEAQMSALAGAPSAAFLLPPPAGEGSTSTSEENSAPNGEEAQAHAQIQALNVLAAAETIKPVDYAQQPNGGGTGAPGGPPGGGSPLPLAAKGEVVEEEPFVVVEHVTYWDITKEFSLLGWIGFGGPAAHIGLFEKRIVHKLRWMTQAVFMEMFALGSCLPGPTSTQVSFAIGTVRKGVWGGLLSGALFQYPGAFIMTGVGIAFAKALQDPAAWLLALTAGVSAVGVALVASAAKGLLIKLCNTELLAIIGTLSAAAAIYWNPPWLFPLIIAIGGLITIFTNRKLDMSAKNLDDGVQSLGVNMWVGGFLIGLWASILIVVEVLVRSLPYDHRENSNPLDWFEVFYRTGSIIYGGGQVVLPMLLADLVKYNCSPNQVPECQADPATSWMTPEQFYAGLGIVQAMPGPLFNFSAYLGAIIAYNAGYVFLIGTVVCWIGLFGPGVMLMFAVLPFWKKFREFQIYRRALPGMNAAAVGLILASVFKMTVDVYGISPFPTSSLCIALFAFTAVDSLKIFEPWVVIGGIALGIIAWAGKMH